MFEYQTDDRFFHSFNEFGFENALIKVTINIYKKNLIQEADIHIQASIPVCCNRCNKSIPYPVELFHRVVIKKGSPADSTEEIIFADPMEECVDFSQFIYDSILTSLPARFIPCEHNKQISCNQSVLKKLEQIESFENIPESESLGNHPPLGEKDPEFFKQLLNLIKN